MHIDLGGGQVVRDDAVEGLLQRLRHRALGRDAFVLLEVPVGEQLQFAPEQGVVVGRQHAGARGELPGQQGVERLQVARVVGGGVLRLDLFHHGLLPQIGQQHEALGLIPGQDVGHQQAGLVHESRHLHEGAAVLALGRRVHDDAAVARHGVDAQVAAETRVGRGRAQAVGPQALRAHQGLQPDVEGGLALGVGPQDGVGFRGHGVGRFGALAPDLPRGWA